MKNINVKPTPWDNTVLKGKVIEDIVYRYSVCSEEDNSVVIKFTDDTYIALGIWFDEDCCPVLGNFVPKEITKIRPLPQYSIVDYRVEIDDDYYNRLIKMGIINYPTPDEMEEAKQQELLENDRKEYKEYLRLKEKFEGK